MRRHKIIQVNGVRWVTSHSLLGYWWAYSRKHGFVFSYDTRREMLIALHRRSQEVIRWQKETNS